MIRHAVLISVLAFLLSGCGLIDYFYLPPPEDTAQELAELGHEAMREKDYGDAIKYFTKLRDRYPFSPYTVDAELTLGDAYYLDEQYLAAADTYKEFEALHPRHQAIPYVLYQIGRSNLELLSSIDRPQNAADEALQYFTRLYELYPDTEFGQKAPDLIKKARRHVAEHELFVADFYWRTERFGAAWRRYQFVVDNFSDIPDVYEYAQSRAEISYYRYQQTRTEVEREEREGSWRDWFDWL